MSYNKAPVITPFEGSTLAQARQAVINAFASGDEDYTWNMLCIFYISTAKIEIINDCEQFKKDHESQLSLINCKTEYSPQEAFSRIIRRDSYRQRTNMEFYKKIMMLCAKYGLTEFDTIKPREGSTGRLGSGPNR